MIGDGVNDVPALKQARLAVAMGSGAQVTKGVADVVLLEDEFARLPEAVAEGRRIARNIHRLGRLYMTKTVYAAALILLVAVPGFAFPFLPRHLTLAGFLTIGIPSFALALAPSDGPLYRGRLLRALAAFAVPAGLGTAIGSILSFFLVDTLFGGSLEAGRTAATTTLIVLGFAFILLLERGPGREHIAIQSYMLVLIFSLSALFALILGIPPVRDFFEMAVLSSTQWFLALLSAAAGLTIAAVLAPAPDRTPGSPGRARHRGPDATRAGRQGGRTLTVADARASPAGGAQRRRGITHADDVACHRRITTRGLAGSARPPAAPVCGAQLGLRRPRTASLGPDQGSRLSVAQRQHELGDDQVRGEARLASVSQALHPDLDRRPCSCRCAASRPGDDLVAEQAGGEDVQLQLDRGEVVAGRDAAEGRPGGDGVAERGPDAAVDVAPGCRCRLSTTIRPLAWESSISSGSISRSPGKLPGRNGRALSSVILELGCGVSLMVRAETLLEVVGAGANLAVRRR